MGALLVATFFAAVFAALFAAAWVVLALFVVLAGVLVAAFSRVSTLASGFLGPPSTDAAAWARACSPLRTPSPDDVGGVA
jgi:hypothetical protein